MNNLNQYSNMSIYKYQSYEEKSVCQQNERQNSHAEKTSVGRQGLTKLVFSKKKKKKKVRGSFK